MSTVLEYARLRPQELAELRRLLATQPRAAHAYAADLRLGDLDEEISSRGIDLDKAWDGLWWLLRKTRPPVDVIGGGEPLDELLHLFPVDDVATAARFLAKTPFKVLARRYSPAKMSAAGVTPDIWGQPEALSYLEEYYRLLVTFFQAAAAAREPIVTWVD
ncbi:MAG: YfbM family protein [Hamadaea sp.]|uniref:YfbM family protein n=1 Tax=Hamadaea sp. TaxID=2024425 RepID=UPI0017A937CD|nr:YfbM family protein [Hamadaea sp.]NUT18639.1 YfbM family protein [Hamadaea sp.]